MKVTIELNGFDEIDEAAALLLAMRDGRNEVDRLRAEPAVAAEPNGHADQGTIPDPRQLELSLDQPAKPPARPKSRVVGVTPISSEDTSTCIVSPDELELPLEEPIDAARERLRGLARERGVTWLRSVLEAAGAQRLGDLPEATVRELLRAQ
jgi:hypothetical protein